MLKQILGVLGPAFILALLPFGLGIPGFAVAALILIGLVVFAVLRGMGEKNPQKLRGQLARLSALGIAWALLVFLIYYLPGMVRGF